MSNVSVDGKASRYQAGSLELDIFTMNPHPIKNSKCLHGCAMVAALAIAATMTVHTEEVFSTDFITIPAELDITQGGIPYSQRPFDYAGSGLKAEGDQEIDVTELGLSGQWLFTPTAGDYNATLTLTGLESHSTLNIGFFLNTGGGLDGFNGGQNDSLEIKIDGVSVFGPNPFGGRFPDRPGWGDTPVGQGAAIIRKSGDNGAPASNLNSHRTGAWGHDALYDMSLDPSLQGIAHTASTATIEFITNRNEGDSDEYFALANLEVETDSSGDGKPFQITAIDYSSEDSMVTLTWPSSEGQKFKVVFSYDLIARDETWADGDLDDDVTAGAGEETTRSFPLETILEDRNVLFFRIERQ